MGSSNILKNFSKKLDLIKKSLYNIKYFYFNQFKKGKILILKNLNQSFIILILLTLFICIFFIPITSIPETNITIIDYTENGGLLWPSPGYYHINYPFGKRVAPAPGASTYHKGIDIGAPQGSEFIAVTDGTITFVGFFGGGGYTITITDKNTTNGEIKYSYCHCDPNFIVSQGDIVQKGQIIGKVGPKYVYGVIGNQYSDIYGKPTNGATSGPHLHFGMRINGNYVNPSNYLPNPNNL